MSTPPAAARLLPLRFFTIGMIGGVAIITAASVIVAPDIVLPAPWVWAILLGLVAVAALGAYVLTDRVPPAAPQASLADLSGAVFPIHVLRCALMELPAMAAFGLAFAMGEPSWVTVAIAAVPAAILMLLLVFPHERVLRRYQGALDSQGAATQFTDRMLGRTVWDVDGGGLLGGGADGGGPPQSRP